MRDLFEKETRLSGAAGAPQSSAPRRQASGDPPTPDDPSRAGNEEETAKHIEAVIRSLEHLWLRPPNPSRSSPRPRCAWCGTDECVCELYEQEHGRAVVRLGRLRDLADSDSK